MRKNRKFLFTIVGILFLTACVDQSQCKKHNENYTQTKNTIEKTLVKKPRIIATSMATTDIMAKLDIDLVGVPDSNIDLCPKRYENLPRVGKAMSPDMEIIKSLNPDYIFSPVSLISDLLPKYQAASIEYGFLNLNNIEGMYKSISDLGNLLGKEKEAKILVDEYEEFIEEYKNSNKGKNKVKVLILMGLPGSYLVATENSYVGGLVELSGAINIYSGTNKQFIAINTEDMLKKDPDIILRTAHAMPDEVMRMFKKDFEENDIWKHFRSVKEKKVYDLDYRKFGMSAKFNYQEALEDLGEILYAE